jgi:Flp pilus assembly protein TadG
MLKRILTTLARRRDGSVSVVVGLSLPVLIAMTGLVAEYGNGLVSKVEDQRVADAAAFYAATAYNTSSSNSVTGAQRRLVFERDGEGGLVPLGRRQQRR